MYQDPITQLMAWSHQDEQRRRHRLKPVQDFLTAAAIKIADAHAAELSKLRLDDIYLGFRREQLRGNRDLAWRATIDQADARFGSKHVEDALFSLGRGRIRM